jgi:hypothetical protein
MLVADPHIHTPCVLAGGLDGGLDVCGGWEGPTLARASVKIPIFFLL